MQNPLYDALVELDEALRGKVEPFDLYTVGGFAMLLNGVRESYTYTDVDYVGPDLPDTVKKAITAIGRKYGFEDNWINNDVLIAGGSIEDIEACTGPLHFIPHSDLSVIHVKTLCNEDLLRMKMIALDTSFMGYRNLGASFTRYKDFADIERLMKSLKMSFRDVVKNTKEYILEPDVYYLLHYYLKTHDKNIVNGQKEEKIINMYKARSETRKATL